MGTSVICHDIKGETYTIPTEELNFRPAVYGIVFKDNTILLSKIFDGYDFPGGGIKKGELIEDSLKREVLEETGVNIQIDTIVSVNEDFFISIESKRKLHSILMYYLCKQPEGDISTEYLDEDEQKIMGKAEWIDIKEIEHIKFINSVDSVTLIKKSREIYQKK